MRAQDVQVVQTRQLGSYGTVLSRDTVGPFHQPTGRLPHLRDEVVDFVGGARSRAQPSVCDRRVQVGRGYG
jgi:hypothetical protein